MNANEYDTTDLSESEARQFLADVKAAEDALKPQKFNARVRRGFAAILEYWDADHMRERYDAQHPGTRRFNASGRADIAAALRFMEQAVDVQAARQAAREAARPPKPPPTPKPPPQRRDDGPGSPLFGDSRERPAEQQHEETDHSAEERSAAEGPAAAEGSQ